MINFCVDGLYLESNAALKQDTKIQILSTILLFVQVQKS